MKENKTKALDLFNKGEGGFKDRDLYVVCAMPRTGSSPHPRPSKVGNSKTCHPAKR
jgi:hypothetical protein